MNAALLALLLAAPCEHPALASMSAERQSAACALLARPAEGAVDRAALEAVYQRPGFEKARARDTGVAQALLAQLRAWLESLFETTGAETYSNVTRVVVLFAAVLAGLFAVLRFAARKKARAQNQAEPAPARLILDSPAAHLERARAALASEPRGAIREGLLALLSHLERQRLARPDRVKTNRELARELPARGAPDALTATVTRLLDWYDGAFYSLDPVAPEAAKRFVEDVAAVAQLPAEASS
ncbi:MAG: hypothetical protein AB1938_05085 [Myxococcota bacterium]